MELIKTVKTTPCKYAIVENGAVVSTHKTKVPGSVPIYKTSGDSEITDQYVLEKE